MFNPKRKKLSQEQWNIVAGKIMEGANLFFIAMVVTQFVPGPFVSSWVALVGLLGAIGVYWFAMRLMKGGGS